MLTPPRRWPGSCGFYVAPRSLSGTWWTPNVPGRLDMLALAIDLAADEERNLLPDANPPDGPRAGRE
jgi:hypothetical protein